MSDIWPAVGFLCAWTWVCFHATKAYILRRQIRADLNQRDRWVKAYQARNKGEAA